MVEIRPLTRKQLASFLPDQRAIRAFEKMFDSIPTEVTETTQRVDTITTDLQTANDEIDVIDASITSIEAAILALQNKTRSVGSYSMSGNSTATTIASTDTPVLVAGTTSASSFENRFTVTATNRATYTGTETDTFSIQAVLSFSTVGLDQVTVHIYKNGSPISGADSSTASPAAMLLRSITCQCLTELEEDDYIELWIENNTGASDITVESLNLIAQAIN